MHKKILAATTAVFVSVGAATMIGPAQAEPDRFTQEMVEGPRAWTPQADETRIGQSELTSDDGHSYIPLTPFRAWDSREFAADGLDLLPSGLVDLPQLTFDREAGVQIVPDDAVAVTYVLQAFGNTVNEQSYLTIFTPEAEFIPNSSTLLFDRRGSYSTQGVTQIGPYTFDDGDTVEGLAVLYFGPDSGTSETKYLIDVTGYYQP